MTPNQDLLSAFGQQPLRLKTLWTLLTLPTQTHVPSQNVLKVQLT